MGGHDTVKRVLIVEPSEMLRTALEAEFQKDCCVYSCSNAGEAELLLRIHRPEGLFLNLRLEGIDGLYFLELTEDCRPCSIITLAAAYSPYEQQRLADLKVAHLLLHGCPVRAIARHLRSAMELAGHRMLPNAQDTVSAHLRILGVPHQGGFDDLRIGTPLFAQAPDMSMTKEFYPAVAKLRGRENWKQVEKAIRTVKEVAYENRNDAVWKEYFPDTSHCPRNKDFIAKLAEFVS